MLLHVAVGCPGKLLAANYTVYDVRIGTGLKLPCTFLFPSLLCSCLGTGLHLACLRGPPFS